MITQPDHLLSHSEESIPMIQLPYHALPSLGGLYLEDSYVLAIQTTGQRVVLTLEAVLTPAHPHYHSPHPNEQYCYERGQLIFPNATHVAWLPSKLRPAIDARGEIDYGNIDIFYTEGGAYHLEGEWGRLDIISDLPTFDVTGDRSANQSLTSTRSGGQPVDGSSR